MPNIRKGASIGRRLSKKPKFVMTGAQERVWKLIDRRLPRSKAWQGSEHDLQKMLVSSFSRIAEVFPPLQLLFAIPNGGGRSKAEAGRLKAEGVKPGVADLFLSVPKNGKHGFYIELKKAGGVASDDQKRFLIAAHMKGYECGVYNDIESVWEAIASYLEIEI